MIGSGILRSLREVHDLREEWEDLFERADRPHVFLSPAWVLNWWKAFGSGDEGIRFVTAREAGRLIGVLPLHLVPAKHRGLRCAMLRLWADAYANRAGPLVDGERRDAALDALAAAVGREGGWDVAGLAPAELAAPTVDGLGRALARHGVRVGVEPGYTSPWMALPERGTDPLDTVSRSFARNLRRKLNRADREGCEVAAPDPDRGVELAFAVSRASWQDRNGTGLDSTPANETFFRGMAEDPWLRERLRILILSRAGEPVAYEWNVRHADVLYNLKVGYREDDAGLSPGLVLRHHAVARAIATAAREFDFLGEVEPYKMHWATGVRPHGTLLGFGPGLRWTAIHGVYHRLRPALKGSPLLVRLVRGLRGDDDDASGSG